MRVDHRRINWIALPMVIAISYALSGCASQTTSSAPSAASKNQTAPLGGASASYTRLPLLPANTPPRNISFGAVDFLNARDGWVTGAIMSPQGTDIGNGIWRTTDGGESWVKSPAPANILALHFTTPLVGFAIAQMNFDPRTGNYNTDELLHTKDGGLTWTVSIKAPQTPGLFAPSNTLSFPDAVHGFAQLGSSLFSTSDGGVRWVRFAAPQTHFVMQGMTFTSKDRGWVIGTVPGPKSAKTGATPTALETFASTDGGRTWTLQYKKSSAYPIFQSVSLSFANARDGWFFYQRTDNMISVLVHTTDGGAHWTTEQPQLFESRFMPRPIQFISPSVGWVPVSSGAAPFPGLIAITNNGGRTFHTVSNNNWNIWSVDLVSANDGWAIGQFGGNAASYLLHTTNGGRSFAQVLPTPYPLTQTQFVNDKTGYGAGSLSDPNVLLRTDNSGATWTKSGPLPYPAQHEINGMAFATPSTGFDLVMPAYSYQPGAKPTLFRTDNAGASWKKVVSHFAMPNKKMTLNGNYLRFWPNGQAIAEVENFPSIVIMRSSNWGRTWTPYASMPVKGGGTSTVQFAAPDQGYALVTKGNDTNLYGIRTVNGKGVFRLDYGFNGATYALALAASSRSVLAMVAEQPYTEYPSVISVSSVNGGDTWRKYAAAMPLALSQYVTNYPYTVMSAVGHTVWWSTVNGLLYSSDFGRTWRGIVNDPSSEAQ